MGIFIGDADTDTGRRGRSGGTVGGGGQTDNANDSGRIPGPPLGCRLGWHSWGVWFRAINYGGAQTVERQKRECRICGFTEARVI
jgi:hypothetical protein